jgi:hypothetical protein
MSRDLWLSIGDENIKYFHNFANYNKNINVNWGV